MSLQYRIKSLEGLDEAVKPLYQKTEAGDFTLMVEGVEPVEDIAGLKSALEKEREARRQANERAQAADEAARKAAEERARKEGDVTALEKSWSDKLQGLETKWKDEKESLIGVIRNNVVHATAVDMATKLAVPGSAETLLPHIEGRLSMEFRDGKAVPVVLDAEGRPSAMTVEELSTEIANKPAFAPVIAATRATGGGAPGAKGGGAAPIKADMSGSKEQRLEALRRKYPALAG